MNFQNIQFETSYGTASQLPPAGAVEIAFSGRSNVGKSSLINKIFNRKNLARVSSVPGKTVTINFFDCDGVKFADLPGYGYAKVSHSEKQRWAALMESYFQSGRNLRLVLQLIDMRHAPAAQDLEMLRFLQSSGIPFVVVLTKCDKLNKTETEKRLASLPTELAEFGDVQMIPFSATKGTGAETIRQRILHAIE